jgi:hypothetical protein
VKYETSVPFHGDPGRALDFVATTLVAIGFNLVERTGTTLIATAPVGQPERRHDQNQNPLVFVSQIEIQAGGGSLSARGRMSSTGAIVICGVLGAAALVCLASAAVMFMGMKDNLGRTAPRGAGFFALVIAVVVFAKMPSLLRYFNHLGRDALDSLVNNAAATASR